MTMPSSSSPAVRYAELLAEANQIRGVSLWQDAWRRLKRNWMAMMSLYFLIGVTIVACVTPLLPLQSPILQDLKHRQFQAPNFRPVGIDVAFYGRRFEQELDQLKARSAAAPTDEREKLTALVSQMQDAGPYGMLWHKPGPMTRFMIQTRFKVFGDWCVPSLCGTDNLGRDILARIFWGARVSLTVGVVAALVSLLIGVSYGATAGYAGGWVDELMMGFVNVLYSIPFIFVVIFLITILSEDSIKKSLEKYHVDQIMIFYLVIGAIYWLTMSRVVRGQVISLKHDQFIDAARTMGASGGRIIFRHLIPNVMGIVIVYLTLTIPAVMLFEAFLSFLGLGVSPPDVSWGLLVNEGLQVITPIKIYWWLVLFPGLTLTLTLFALNFLGDGLRDALDPRMKNR